jgi:hypothetical protein
MSGENAMTQASDELLLTTVAPVRGRPGMWRGIPIGWLAAGVLALAFAALLLALPRDVLTPLAGGYTPGFAVRSVIALAGAGLVGALMMTIFYMPLPQFGSLTISVPGGSRPVTVRRADAHPDAPPRRPLFAQDEIGEPWQPEHVADPEGSSQAPKATGSIALGRDLPAANAPVDSLISRLETGLTHKQTPSERNRPRALGPDEAEHPSPAIRQQRELGEALRQSLDQLGGRIGTANS